MAQLRAGMEKARLNGPLFLLEETMPIATLKISASPFTMKNVRKEVFLYFLRENWSSMMFPSQSNNSTIT